MRNFGLLPSNAFAWAGILAFGIGLSACETETRTELTPAGPPMVLQVFADEVVPPTEDDPTGDSNSEQLLFGDHQAIEEAADDRMFVTAASEPGRRFQIVFDELLVGNNLEEIACADGSFDRVPQGATPDDIAACSPSSPQGLADCTAVCADNGGILDTIGAGEEPDGAADDFRFIEGVVTITCDGMEMPIDAETSFYNPSGNQLISGRSGVDSLGPAIFIFTLEGLRANSECAIGFAETVVDKDGNQVCAPADGKISNGCTPGDTALLTFNTEVLTIAATVPEDGAADVNPNARAQISFTMAVAPASVDAVTVTTGGTEVPATVSAIDPDRFIVSLEGQTGFEPNTSYTITITGAGVTDLFGATMEQDVSFSFITGSGNPLPPDAGMGDAGMTDAGIDAGMDAMQ